MAKDRDSSLRFADGLPPPLMTSEPGSFAQNTILLRKPQILEKVLTDNEYPSSIVERLTQFRREIAGGTVQPLFEDAPDVEEWNRIWLQFSDKTWLDLPWYFAESYFYRRVLEAVEYFQHEPSHARDPFLVPKEQQLSESIIPLCLATDALRKIECLQSSFENLLHASLWGNRVDLSNFTVTEDVRRRQGMIERENLLIDDSLGVIKVFQEHSPSHIAFINDNVGVELGFDLCLAEFLLRNEWSEKILFYLKPWPFFVSDAMPKDLVRTVLVFAESSAPSLSLLGRRLQEALSDGKLSWSADWFWASPYHFPEMPKPLYEEISHFDLVISKGDVSYRRLLSDRHWSYTTPITRILHYFPASLLILRTLKGEIVAGLMEGQAEKIEREDPDWLINGKRGIIQYVERKVR